MFTLHEPFQEHDYNITSETFIFIWYPQAVGNRLYFAILNVFVEVFMGQLLTRICTILIYLYRICGRIA